MTSEEEIVKLRMALAEAADEIDVLKARLDGDIPRALHWLQGKAERQRHAPGRPEPQGAQPALRAAAHEPASRAGDGRGVEARQGSRRGRGAAQARRREGSGGRIIKTARAAHSPGRHAPEARWDGQPPLKRCIAGSNPARGATTATQAYPYQPVTRCAIVRDMGIFEDLAAEQERLEKILLGLDEAQWLSPSAAEGWTIADVVLHLAQSEEGVEATAAHRQLRTGLAAAAGVTMDDRAAQAVQMERAAPAEVFARWQHARQAGLAAL